MILFTILMTILAVLAAIVLVLGGTIGGTILLLFGDVAVCVLIIVGVIWLIKKLKR